MSARRRDGAARSEEEHRAIHRLVPRAVVIVAVTAAGAAWLAAKGPVKVIVGTTEIDEIAPTWYMLAAFPVLGMVLADVLDAALEAGPFAKRTLLLGASAALRPAAGAARIEVAVVGALALLVIYFLNTPRTPPATSAVTSRSTDGSRSPPGAAR